MYELTIIQKIATWSIPVIFAITLHEVAHGWVANKLGDPTAKMLGRLTINPIKHIDLVGTLLVPGILILLPHVNFIFGWAKPVPIAFQNLRHPRRDMAIVAAAGPASNFLMAAFWALIVKLGITLAASSSSIQGNVPAPAFYAVYMGYAGILINIVLMVLNLIPLPPLDGSRVVTSFLSPKYAYYYNKLERVGLLLLIILLMTGGLAFFMRPAIMFFFNFFVDLFNLGAINRIL